MTPIARRTLLGSLIVGGAAPVPATTAATAWDFRAPSLDGGTLDFGSFRGRVLLVVNTASFCGYTYQYTGLEKLHRDLAPRGLTVIGVPSQDFEQEKGSNAEVKAFCELTYGVQFPMTEISHVRGQQAMPFYAWVRAVRHWQPGWNFAKVLVGRNGAIKGTFGPTAEPGGPELTEAIGAELAALA